MLGWVDFSAEERKRADSVLELAKTPGAVDEIGVGVIRDGFAGRFFPGTSTLHTRPRYFYLITYIMKDVEHDPACADEQATRRIIDGLESKTADKLIAWAEAHGEPTDGITGRDMRARGEWVKRAPSVMDWSSLAVYGLLSDPDLKLSGYVNLVSNNSKKTSMDDADGQGIRAASGLWNVPSLPIYHTWNSGDEIPLRLYPEEAEDLRERICRCKARPTVYSALLQCDNPASIRDNCSSEYQSLSFIEFVESYSGMLTDLGDCLSECQLAAEFSALSTLLHIRFNHVLREKAGVLDEQDPAYTNWVKQYKNQSRYYELACQCDIERAFKVPGINSYGGRNKLTASFLEDAQNAIRTGRLLDLDKLIIERERSLKTLTRSKIEHANQYCNNWFGGFELTYRFEVALKFACEIVEAARGELK